jgi:hypothetical protein
MTEHINAVLFYLAGKNYFNGAAEINSAIEAMPVARLPWMK